ncbi:MAG: hypothetical protein AB1656_14155 [Candidatus Omnitrophota bacterium]
MKSVFILGAGASREAGGPLMNDFFDKAEGVYAKNLSNPQFEESKRFFENVFNALNQLKIIYAKSNINIHNIETVFGLLEMKSVLNECCEWDIDTNELHDSLIALIIKTLSGTIIFKSKINPGDNRGKAYFPPDPYIGFIGTIIHAAKKYNSESWYDDISFITFNYDLSLDFALACELKKDYLSNFNVKYEYHLTNSIEGNKISLLKLHGSMNWIPCRECYKDKVSNFINIVDPQEIITHNYKSEGKNIKTISNEFFEGEYLKIDDFLKRTKNITCNHEQSSPLVPFLIPPTLEKISFHKQISNVWKKAASVISKAENIFVIGYSLPETDTFFKYLYALGSIGKTRIKRFYVYDPNPEVHERFRSLIGEMVSGRFKGIKCSFRESIHHIDPRTAYDKDKKINEDSIEDALKKAYNL